MNDINLTDSNEILSGLAEIIEEIAGPRKNPIVLAASFDADLDLDSLTMVEIIVAAEERFDIRIPDAAFAELTTVGNAVDFIARSAAEKASA